MTPGFKDIIGAAEADRRDLFLAAALRLGTPIQNVEKDFWVCWVLDLLFNARQPQEPRLLFKGGTSLSKSFGLISRFSEDIDITVFREDLGQAIEVENLEGLSGKKQRAHLNAIKEACQQYISGPLKKRLETSIQDIFKECGLEFGPATVTLDPDDSDQQTLLVAYPAVSAEVGAYNSPTVKIEAGAKSALDPHRATSVTPYLAEDVPQLALTVSGVVTIDAERTFWDKVVILHGLRRRFEVTGEFRGDGQRVSRHYYDLHRLMESEVGPRALADPALGADCVRHARLFFNRPELDLATAKAGTFTLAPVGDMVEALRRDYGAMSAMIFGPIPAIQAVLQSVAALEARLNAG